MDNRTYTVRVESTDEGKDLIFDNLTAEEAAVAVREAETRDQSVKIDEVETVRRPVTRSELYARAKRNNE
jgi:hypothetical protein